MKIFPMCLANQETEDLPESIVEENKRKDKECSVCLERKSISIRCQQCSIQICKDCHALMKQHQNTKQCPGCRKKCDLCKDGINHEYCEWMEPQDWRHVIHIKIPLSFHITRSNHVTQLIEEESSDSENEDNSCDKCTLLYCNCHDNPNEGINIRYMKGFFRISGGLIAYMFFGMLVGLLLMVAFAAPTESIGPTEFIMSTIIGTGFNTIMFYCCTRCCCDTNLSLRELL